MPSYVESFPLDTITWNGHEKSEWGDALEFIVMSAGNVESFSSVGPSECGYCGEYLRWARTANGLGTSSTCSASGGMEYSFTLNVPSGKIVFADSLFDVFDKWERKGKERINYNSVLGRKEASEFMEEQNVAYGPVLNTSPDIFLDTETNSIIVASPGDWDEEDNPIVPETWKRLGNVITDLWAYSITDFDTYVSRGGDPDNKYVTVAEVPVGTYTFTHYADVDGFDEFDDEAEEEAPTIYADSVFSPLAMKAITA